jgi:uncharacterized protein (UPF0147 family)
MSDYASRMAERYGMLQRIAQPDVPIAQGYVPLFARRGPDYGVQELGKLKESLQSERKRVRQERIDELLKKRPWLDWACTVPLGASTSIQEMVQRNPHVVLLSEAGAGKTTVLRYLVTHPPLEDVLMILVDLPDLAMMAQDSLPEYLSEDAQERLSLTLSPEFFADALTRGQTLLCFDGLDQVATQEDRARVVYQIESWAEQFPRCRFLVTARANAYEPPLDPDLFAHYVLTPWNEALVADLEHAWNEALDAWTVDGRTARRAFYAERRRMWSDLALAMHEQHRLSASVEEAKEWLADAAQHDPPLNLNQRKARHEAESLIDEGAPQLDMICKDDAHLGFVHRLLQDVLAARAIETRCVEHGVASAWNVMQPHLWDVTWAETLALTWRFLSQDHPALWSELLAHALKGGESDALEPALRRHLLFAASALAASDISDELDPDLRKRVVDELINWFSDAEAVGRREAADALFQWTGDTYAVEGVLQLAQDDSLDDWARQAATLLLGKLGRDRVDDAVTFLQALVENDQEGEPLRKTAIVALEELAFGAASDQEPRTVVAKMVEWVRDPDIPHTLRAMLAEFLSSAVADEHDEAILETLIALARGESDEEKVLYAVQIAAARGVGGAARTMNDAQLNERLWEWVHDEKVNVNVRIELAEALGSMERAEEAASVLLDLACNLKIAYVAQKKAMAALGRLGYADPPMIDQVAAIAQATDRKVKDFVRLEAAHTLGRLGRRTLSMEHLLRLVADKSVSISTRRDAFAAIGELGLSGQDVDLDEATVAILRVWANEENTTEEVREQAIQMLTTLGADQEAFVRDLTAIVQNRRVYTRVRRVAAKALGTLPVAWADVAGEAMRTVFYDQEEANDPLRVVIARSLLHFGPDESVLEYLKAASEQSYLAPVRHEAALALGEFDEVEQAVPPLLALAQDAKIADDIRQGAIRALSLWATGDEQVVQGLYPILENPELEPTVREEAYATVKAITTI